MIFSLYYNRYRACFGKKITENRQKALPTHILYCITQVASVLFNDERNHSSNEKQNNLNLKPSGSDRMNRAG